MPHSRIVVATITGEVLVDEKELELLLERVISKHKPLPITSGPMPEPDPFKGRMSFTAKEAAKILGISVKSVYRLIQRHLLNRSQALRTIRISREEIQRFLEASKEQP